MTGLSHQRCFNHTLREAVARCPQCGQFYCRECITEHDDRVICAACLRRIGEAALQPRTRLRWLSAALPCAGGFVVLWLFFYLCGEILLQIPSRYHEGTVWVERWFGGQ